ncbi:MAG: ATP-binding cassette domain-containing protein [Chloroflexi bacterium]|nr:ATP-binding cassette domain-containing protein [Chloroflexota bacterium]MCI0578541.1 ATP-binding cassette domain-containing protein [Chloroflexota bacterium]MCI0647463.1 ATP-binding cassette domain-containing protein [Chloroflexota bacterium]MCI0728743.1 ATP-binding cassette domain-containing protein [Chloroflexota bacterium]
MSSAPLLRMEHIHKSFSNVAALHDVSLEVQGGEVHALLGENGAGKSTLMNILAGVYPCDAGQVWWHGQPVCFKTPREAQQAGICTIYQETNLLPELTVAQNIFLGYEPLRLRGLPIIDKARMVAQSRQLLDLLELAISPDAPVSSLSVAEKRMVEVAKALRQSADLIIMDEPTASFTPPESDILFRVVHRLSGQGVAIVYITHRLPEMMAIADRATILRDGRKVATLGRQQATPDELARLIAGREINDKYPQRYPSPGPEVLRVERLTRYGVLDDISFTLRAGEIVGVTELRGSGRTALLRTIFGLDPLDEGAIYVHGQPATVASPQEAIKRGIIKLAEIKGSFVAVYHIQMTAAIITLIVPLIFFLALGQYFIKGILAGALKG